MLFVLPEVFTLVLGPSFDLPCLLATAILDSFSLFYLLNISNWEGAGNLLHCQMKLSISTNMWDLRTRRDFPKFVWIPLGGRWVQGAAAGTKAPVPRGVHAKEGSPLWVALSVALTVDLKKGCTTWKCCVNSQHESGELSFVWGKMRTAVWEASTSDTSVEQSCRAEMMPPRLQSAFCHK